MKNIQVVKKDGKWVTVDVSEKKVYDNIVSELSVKELKAWRDARMTPGGKSHPFDEKYPGASLADIFMALFAVSGRSQVASVKKEPYNLQVDYKALATRIVKENTTSVYTEKAPCTVVKQSDRVAVIGASLFQPGKKVMPLTPKGTALTSKFLPTNHLVSIVGDQCVGETPIDIMKDFKNLAIMEGVKDVVKKACIESAPEKLKMASRGTMFRPRDFKSLSFSKKVKEEAKIQMAAQFQQAIGTKTCGAGYFAQSHMDGATEIVGNDRSLQDRISDFIVPLDATVVWTDVKDVAVLNGMRNKMIQMKRDVCIFYDGAYADYEDIREKSKKVQVPVLPCPLRSVKDVVEKDAKIHVVFFKTPNQKKGKGDSGITAVKDMDSYFAKSLEDYYSYQFYVSVFGWRSDVPLRLSAFARRGYAIRMGKVGDPTPNFIDVGLNALYHAMTYVWVRQPFLFVERYRGMIDVVTYTYDYSAGTTKEDMILIQEIDLEKALEDIVLEEEKDLVRNKIEKFYSAKTSGMRSDEIKKIERETHEMLQTAMNKAPRTGKTASKRKIKEEEEETEDDDVLADLIDEED